MKNCELRNSKCEISSMRYAVIIPDGAADEPIGELGNRTPLEAARLPNIDWVASHGRSGTVKHIPASMLPGSDIAIMSLMGYDPKSNYTGRAPIEAEGRGIKLADEDWVFRANLVTIIDGKMIDYSAGHISSQEGQALIDLLGEELASDSVELYPGVSYRHLVVFRGTAFKRLRSVAPHDIIDQAVQKHLPKGKGSANLREMMAKSAALFENNEINEVRRQLNESPATQIWLWGQGTSCQLESFRKRFGLRGGLIAGTDLIKGLGRLVGWENIEVAGATGYLDTDYEAKGQAAVEALNDYDLVVVHVEAPDEAGHIGDAKAKLAALEAIDKHVVGPILEELRKDKHWRVLICPDHPTPVRLRTHVGKAVPFALAGKNINAVVSEPFSEANAEAADLHVERGWELMEYFIKT